ncbi:glycosyltransferase family 2 protein (plasmid) [Sphingobium sp. JS3065]|uniref:glycosyltransferase family 2 protein n=1 Tax=Sphingobium sp. JS3065 TaxID=2970925 RepID=UPI002264CA46|nr:glycosyltransferase family 2 protein [Sphingobium sp. JS3065]UZW58056.1 glycosyltransferase family 2 protein [Sphingobium sp. JS3065]
MFFVEIFRKLTWNCTDKIGKLQIASSISGLTAAMPTTLSICIPSYRRRDLIRDFAREVLSFPGNFEIVIHLDGDVDGSAEALTAITDTRLKVSSAPNAGRASAIARALSIARGRYVMIYDDDDTLTEAGLREILADCSRPLPDGICGFIYHMSDQGGQRLGSAFGVTRSNFIKLRADENVKADKKEVVLREIVNRCNTFDIGSHRRVPTSLLWARIALDHDVLCREVAVGQKNYDAEGMTARLKQLKRRDPLPMFETHRLRFRAWTRGRYKSGWFAVRSAFGALQYGALAFSRRWARK